MKLTACIHTLVFGNHRTQAQHLHERKRRLIKLTACRA